MELSVHALTWNAQSPGTGAHLLKTLCAYMHLPVHMCTWFAKSIFNQYIFILIAGMWNTLLFIQFFQNPH